MHKSSPLSLRHAQGSGQARRNHAKQLQLQKRQAIVDASRVFRNGPSAVAGVSSGTGLGRGLSSSSSGGAPRIVVICTLTQDVDSWATAQALEDEGEDGGVRPVPGARCQEARSKGQPFVELDLVRYRTTLQIYPMPYGALYPLLDAAKGADFILFALSASTSIEPGSWGELAMRALQAQGLPSVIAGCPTLDNSDNSEGVSTSSAKKTSAKAINEVRKSLLSFTQYFAPDVEKVHALDDRSERSALLRTVATSSPRRVAWRDYRAWLMAEEAQWEATPSAGAEKTGTEPGVLRLTGWARGAPLSANRLVHIPDYGDYIVEKITAAPKARHPSRRRTDAEMSTAEDDVLDTRDEEIADDLISENEVDDLDNEQTWPTQEELDQGGVAETVAATGGADVLPPAAVGTTPSSITKNGASGGRRRYGANWIRDEDDEDDTSAISEDGMEESGDEEVSTDVDEGSAAANGELQRAAQGTDMDDDDYDEAFEAEELAAYKERMEEERARRKAEETERAFPDEVDTPLEIPARTRFQRYRGLKSLRTSEWDPYEDLPREYERIFQFDDYKKTRRRVEASAVEEGVAPGVRICLWIGGVPRRAADRARAFVSSAAPGDGTGASGGADSAPTTTTPPLPFVVFGLLRHEHKKSVLNFTVARNTEYEATVKSKDTLVLCLGPRRLRVQPIFSQHDPGNSGRRGTNNVHKMERFLYGTGSTGYVGVGTCVGPVTFGGANVPAVLLRERALDGEGGHDQRGIGATQMPHLVGTGSLLDADPTRIVAKRIVLTGHPYKVHKRTSTIRFMFFNPEDVRYFAPLELRTKMGRIGHIAASLGTHGYFKAHFDGKLPLSQLDTVGMTLYKRTFPKDSQLYRDSRTELPIPTSASASADGEDGHLQTDDEADDIDMA